MDRKKFTNGYEAITVELTNFRYAIGRLLWNTYRMTWSSLQEKEYDPNDEVVRNACFDIIRGNALPTPKESIDFNFVIKNISRVCLAQITRGRIGWWFNVESQMPEYLNHGVTIPKNLYNSEHMSQIENLVNESQKLYEQLKNEGYPPQDLRYLCLHGQQTSMIANTNYSALSSFFIMRTENGLTDELNLVARMMKREIKEKIFEAMEAKFIDNLEFDLWQEMISRLDCLGANKKVCLNTDVVFGNTGRYPSGSQRVASEEGDIKPRFDFKKSAWYQELLDLDESLLLPDEKEMIEKWKN